MNHEILAQIANDERRPQKERDAARRESQKAEDTLIEESLTRGVKHDTRYPAALRRLCNALREKSQSGEVDNMVAPAPDMHLIPELVELHRRTSSQRIKSAVIYTLGQMSAWSALRELMPFKI